MGDRASSIDLGSLAQQLRSILDNPDATAGADEAQRLEVKQLARAVSVALEQPFETVQRLAYSVRPISFRARHSRVLFPRVLGTYLNFTSRGDRHPCSGCNVSRGQLGGID